MHIFLKYMNIFWKFFDNFLKIYWQFFDIFLESCPPKKNPGQDHAWTNIANRVVIRKKQKFNKLIIGIFSLDFFHISNKIFNRSGLSSREHDQHRLHATPSAIDHGHEKLQFYQINISWICRNNIFKPKSKFLSKI